MKQIIRLVCFAAIAGISAAAPWPVLAGAKAGEAKEAAAAPFRPGSFHLVGMREAAGGIELTSDGRFKYGFTYGALDEYGEGKWRQDSGRLLLSTDPPYVDPEFVPASASKTDEVPFRVLVNGPDGNPMSWPVDTLLEFADGTVVEGYTQRYGYIVELDAARPPVSLRLGLRMFGLISPPFKLDVARANDLVFTLQPHSLGQPRFIEQPVEVEGDRLVVDYNGMRLTFERDD